MGSLPWPNGDIFLIFLWLIAYGALLGPIGGILRADYFVIRRCRLDLDALYDEEGEYRYTKGVSVIAIVALLAGVLPSLPGFLEEVKLLPAGSVPRPLAPPRGRTRTNATAT
jgi:NCS1 family nucleobase:cation symporter-1